MEWCLVKAQGQLYLLPLLLFFERGREEKRLWTEW